MPLKLSLTPLLIALLFFACAVNDDTPALNYELTPDNVIITTEEVNQNDSTFFRFFVRWDAPSVSTNLQSYHIWFDSSITIGNAGSALGNSIEISKEDTKFDITDTVNWFIQGDQEVIPCRIWARHNGQNGDPKPCDIVLKDSVPPDPLDVIVYQTPDSIMVEWQRPGDGIAFFNPHNDSGAIFGYDIEFHLDSTDTGSVLLIDSALTAITYISKGIHRVADTIGLYDATVTDTTIRWSMLDGRGKYDSIPGNYNFKITGLIPKSNFAILFKTYDVNGNVNAQEIIGKLTDPQRPVIPEIQTTEFVQSGTRLMVTWRPSQDLSGIDGYELKYIVKENLEDTISVYENLKDSLAFIDSSFAGFYKDSISYLIPGDTMLILLRSVDKSGYYSLYDTTQVTFEAQRFGAGCPDGFASVGDSVSHFCIQENEFVVNDTQIVNNVSAEVARNYCQGLSDATFTVDLCSESQWLRSCQGPQSTLKYGIIQYPDEDEITALATLAAECNIFTNDSVSAASLSLHSRKCVSLEGVKDLPGQFQEWVLADQDSTIDYVIHGASYKKLISSNLTNIFDLAQCSARYFPNQERVNYALDSIFFVRNSITDSLVRDTVLFRTDVQDTSKRLEAISVSQLDSTALTTLHIYEVMEDTLVVGMDTLSLEGQDSLVYLNEVSASYTYRFQNTFQAFVKGVGNRLNRPFYRDPSISFRCCAIEP